MLIIKSLAFILPALVPQKRTIRTDSSSLTLKYSLATFAIKAVFPAPETPNGVAYYQNRINFYTSSEQYSAKEIHEIGLSEVARIKSEMLKI